MGKWDPQADEIFADALEIEAPADRKALLDRCCGGDQTLRDAVEELLKTNEQAGSTMEFARSPSAPIAVGLLPQVVLPPTRNY